MPPEPTTEVSSGGAPAYAVRLLGKFDLRCGTTTRRPLENRKTQELLGYLLVFRGRPHNREVLAGALWPDSTAAQSRKYLRQSVWQLRAMDGSRADGVTLLRAETDWVQVNSESMWLDVAQLEHAFAGVRVTPGEQVSHKDAEALKKAVPLYEGDLLEGCFQDWCIYERERLKAMYLALLEKLLGYCEAHRQPEEGFTYGERLLRHDRAHERAHWRLMRLHYLAGDRTGALRQFERCREALDDELGVTPGERIQLLCEQVRADKGIGAQGLAPGTKPPALDRGPNAGATPSQLQDGQQADALTKPRQGFRIEPFRQVLHALGEAQLLLEQSIRNAEAETP
jgi:DNA-binding SARP family transcriptional activator